MLSSMPKATAIRVNQLLQRVREKVERLRTLPPDVATEFTLKALEDIVETTSFNGVIRSVVEEGVSFKAPSKTVRIPLPSADDMQELLDSFFEAIDGSINPLETSPKDLLKQFAQYISMVLDPSNKGE